MSFTPNYLSQRDPAWKNEKLGFDDTITLGTDGCALTCLTMLVNGYGFSETPSTLNRKFKDMGSGVAFMGGLIVWGGLTRAFPKIAFRRIIVCRDDPAPINEINASLDSGQPVIVEVDRSPSPGLQNHWVVLYKRQGSDYLMLDPWPIPTDNKDTSFVARFAQGRDTSEFITAAVWYEAVGTTPPTPTPVPGDGLYVRVQSAATAGLRMRSGPTVSAGIVTVEPVGTLLRCLEADAVALSKIGVDGQWLQVSDPGGLTGYVAAWYVGKAGGSSPTPVPNPTPNPVPVPATLTVVVSSSAGTGLRMRSQPDVTASIVVIVAAGIEMSVIEPEAQARPKVGQMNQWLNVRDGSGHVGYVAAWYVEFKTPAPVPDPVPVPVPQPSALTVFVSSQASLGLHLREGPSASANSRKVLVTGTRLQVLEAAEAANAKIGVLNQWLNVKEPGGLTGYVAAWYVNK